MPEVWVKVEAARNLQKLTATGDENIASAKVVQKDPRHFEVAAIPASTLPAGLFSLEVSLQPTGEDGQILPAKKMMLLGFMHEEVEPMPSPLILGALSVGQTAEETIVLRSLTGKSFKVENWHTRSKDLRIDLVKIGDKKESVFSVSQKSTACGDQWTEAVFRVQVENQPSREITLKISYHGLEKVLSVDLRSEKY